jgi:hypothetical protein
MWHASIFDRLQVYMSLNRLGAPNTAVCYSPQLLICQDSTSNGYFLAHTCQFSTQFILPSDTLTPELLEWLTRTEINGLKENMVQTGCLELTDEKWVHWWVVLWTLWVLPSQKVFPIHKPNSPPPRKFVLKESFTVPTQNMFTFMHDNKVIIQTTN